MRSARYGDELLEYGLDWSSVEYALENDSDQQYDSPGDRYSSSSTDDRYSGSNGGYDPLTGYGVLDLTISYKGGWRPSYQPKYGFSF